MFPSVSFQARLVRARALSPLVRELTFEREGGEPVAFAPGQWVNLFLPLPEGETKKAYSIASRPDGSPRFELAVTRVEGGAASELLHGLDPGAAVRVHGPHGFFTREASDRRPALFVATGTGLSPLRSMIQAAVAEPTPPPLVLLFGCRGEEEVLWRDELEALAARGALRTEVTLSRAPDAWRGRRGYVQGHVAELYRALAERAGEAPQLFVCGLDRMVGAVRELAKKELGADRRAIHHERFD